MMLRFVSLLICAGGLVSGQIAIKNHATGAALGSPYILPDAPVNDAEQLQIDIVNMGAGNVTVNSAVVFGQYYSLCCETAFTLAPTAVQTLTLTFNPLNTGYSSGSLQIDAQVILLFAQGVPAASLFLQTAAGTVQAHAGVPLTFAADPPSLAHITCVLKDGGSGPVTVRSLSVSGEWTLGGAPLTPLVLQAGQEITFTLDAAGAAADGTVSGVVAIDQWSYALIAQPTQPNVHIQVVSPLKSGEQSPISIQFNPAPTSAITGTLRLSFDASTAVALEDPAIIFPSTGTASAGFTSAAGAADASFGGASSVIFQTGTTEGTVHITAVWGNDSTTSDVHITAEPVGIESISTHRESNALDVIVTGYDNTRTAGRLSFSFFDSKGGFIGSPVTADFTELFYSYFFQTEYNAGGMFKMTAHFPVTGNPGQVSAVQVDLMNSAGDAQSSITPF